nr:dihydropteroate synthase [Deinococcus peraridilitoris]
MGILNVTPDSFSDGGAYRDLPAVLARAHELQAAGALMLDVGGESTRPGAQAVSAREELARILPVIAALREVGSAVISVDTMKSSVAREALAAGAHLVNDVSGLRDPAMLGVCAQASAPAVIMHMQGEPRTMQHQPHYGDVAREVFGFLQHRAEEALAAGVPSVILDPGIGFGKTLEHNLTLLRELRRLTVSGHPVLVGASRKRLIDFLAGVPHPRDRDPGSLALHLHAASTGAALVRVHDVAAHVQGLKVWEVLNGSPSIDQ